MKAVIEFHVSLSLPLDEDFTPEDAQSAACHIALEKELFIYLYKWPDHPKSCDCEVMDVTIERTPERERERFEDDGRDYSHPSDFTRGVED